jgi:hypothetical protein
MNNGANNILLETGAYKFTINIRTQFPEVK